jgi:adenylate cyclase
MENRIIVHYKSHIAYRDNVNNLETVQKIADLRTGLEVSLREKEIGLLEQPGKRYDREH